jgi:hypothetical protein
MPGRLIEFLGLKRLLQFVGGYGMVLTMSHPGIDMPVEALASEVPKQPTEAAKRAAAKQSAQHATHSSAQPASSRRSGTTLPHKTAEQTAQATYAAHSSTGGILPRLRMLHELMGQQRNRRHLNARRQVSTDAATA